MVEVNIMSVAKGLRQCYFHSRDLNVCTIANFPQMVEMQEAAIGVVASERTKEQEEAARLLWLADQPVSP